MRLHRVKLPARVKRWCRVIGVRDGGVVDWKPLPDAGVHVLYAGTVLLAVHADREFEVFRIGPEGSLDPMGDRRYTIPDDMADVLGIISGAHLEERDPGPRVSELLAQIRAHVAGPHDPGYMGEVRAALECRSAGASIPDSTPAAIASWAGELACDVAAALGDLMEGTEDLYALEQRWGALKADTRAIGMRSERYRVVRTDGRDRPGGDRHGAQYLVLDLTHDEHARAGAAAYATAVMGEYPALADDLLRLTGVRAAWEDAERSVDDRASEMLDLTAAAARDRILSALDGFKADGAIAIDLADIRALVIAHLTAPSLTVRDDH